MTEPPTSQSTSTTSKYNLNRLYIGNLDPSVDEFTIVKLFQPFGKITLLDFLFHNQGIKRGQSRGYCFIEYSKREEALQAIQTMNQKTVRGRNIVVSYAHSAAIQNSESNKSKKYIAPSTAQYKRPTTFSLLRNQNMINASSTEAKIKALERKLNQLQKTSGEKGHQGENSGSSKPPKPS
ncbi:uncharacterized protein VTP21DRAFT_8316 [Calcarisporiella thermophila]|uniref:uncharacterized protein n=1 Tax=Calcarisporiella thermophila TaxID=911321 RepID=UPI003742A92B